MEEPPTARVSEAAAAGAAAPASSTSKGPVKWSSSLIFKELNSEKQTSEMIYKALVARFGAEIVPPIKTIAAQLSTKGERMGGKRVKVKKQVFWIKSKTPPRSKGSGKASAQKARRERNVEAKDQIKQRAIELQAQPLSAFMLFGFSQRGIMKRHASAAAVREVVKAVGERWVLLSEEERASYERMAEEDKQRAVMAAERAAATAAAIEAAGEEDAGEEDAGEEDEQGDDDEQGGGDDDDDAEPPPEE